MNFVNGLNRFAIGAVVLSPLILSGVSTAAQAPPATANPTAPPAITPPTPATPAAAVAPFLLVTQYDKVGFMLPSLATLQTWQIQSDGVGDVELSVWYIAGGKATLRDQRTLSWGDKQVGEWRQKGTWRVMLMEQKAASENLLPSVGLQTAYDTTIGPESAGVGLADSASRAPIHLPSPFFLFYNTINAEDPIGVTPNRPFVLYAAQTQKSLVGSRLADLVARNAKMPIEANNRAGLNNPFNGRDISGFVALDETKPVEALTRRSKTPGTAFLVLTLRWNPPVAAPKP